MFMNVMYGYCGASFSGRMPSADVADSVVEYGRTVLKQCIARINADVVWKAEVLYGDTDSLFVVLRGRSQEEAFRIGEEIASTITSQYPHPIELKFEKVYNPLILVSKKRYVGWRYDHIGSSPILDAKGIETVRRDGCEATVKVMKKVLTLLFQNRDLSQLKCYMNRVWSKLLNGHYALNDFVIAKEVRLGKYSSTLPAHAVAITKAMAHDPMRAPKYGERVKYVVI
jgi:DNA polymerase zeta